MKHLIGLSLLIFLSACQLNPFASEPPTPSPPPPTPTLVIPTPTPLPPTDIVSHLRRDGRFTQLLSLLETTQVEYDLFFSPAMTLLAPTDAAFEFAPRALRQTWLAQPDQIDSLLRYHLIFGQVSRADLSTHDSIGTVLGPLLKINHDGTILNDAWITTADIEATNGLIHIIDSLLTPPLETPLQTGHILEVLENEGRFETFLAWLDSAGLTENLRQPGPLTLFAPTDTAIQNLPSETVTRLNSDPSILVDILRYHLVSGKYTLDQAMTLKNLETEARRLIFAAEIEGQALIDGRAKVIEPDLEASNGTIHGIDTLLIPIEP